MANKYYWLKLQRGFFKRHDIKLLRAQENGDTKAFFYLALLAESIDHEGALRFSEDIPYEEDELAGITDTDPAIAADAIEYLKRKKLVIIEEDGTIILPKALEMIGSETEWAEKKREYRERVRDESDIIEDNERTKKDNVPECPDNVRQSKSKSKSKSKIKNKRETPPAVATPPAPVKKSLSPMKDTLADCYQRAITEIQPPETWGDHGKERQQLNILARKTRALLPTVPYENEFALAATIVSHFMRMREYGSDKRIRSSPVIPSKISQFWPEIITSLADEYEEQKAAAGMENILF